MTKINQYGAAIHKLGDESKPERRKNADTSAVQHWKAVTT
jgi:hypothetical protein